MLKNNRQNITFGSIYLIFSTIVNSILSLIRQFFIATILGPVQFGNWNLIRITLEYSHYLDFGSNTGVLYERSKYIGQKQHEKAIEVRQQGFCFAIIVSFILSFFSICISFVPIKIIEDISRFIYFLSISIPLFTLLNFYSVEARIIRNFKALSISMIIASSFGLIFTFLISIYISENILEWIVVSWLGGMFLSLLYLVGTIQMSFVYKLDYDVIKKILVIGFTLSLIPVVLIIFRTLDRWILTSIINSIDFGYYAFGMTVGMFLFTIPGTLGMVLSTYLIQNFGATGNPKTSNSIISVSIFLSSYLMAFIAGAIVIIIPFLLNHFLQNYISGENVIKIVVVSNCALFALPITNNFLLSIKKKNIVFSILFLMIIFEVLFVWLFASKFGVYGGAISVLLVSILGNIIFLMTTFLIVRDNIYQAIRDTVNASIPIFLLVAISAFIDNESVMVGLFWEDFKTTIFFLIYYLSISLPVASIFFWLSKTLYNIKYILKNDTK